MPHFAMPSRKNMVAFASARLPYSSIVKILVMIGKEISDIHTLSPWENMYKEDCCNVRLIDGLVDIMNIGFSCIKC